jgi:hypothetical protein
VLGPQVTFLQALLHRAVAGLSGDGDALLVVGVPLDLLGTAPPLHLACTSCRGRSGRPASPPGMGSRSSVCSRTGSPVPCTAARSLFGEYCSTAWFGSLSAANASLSVLGLVLAAVKIVAELAYNVLDHLLFHPAVIVLQLDALEVVFACFGYVIYGVADPVGDLGALLHVVRLAHRVVGNNLLQVALKLSDVALNDGCAVLLLDLPAALLLLGEAHLLHVGIALVHVNIFSTGAVLLLSLSVEVKVHGLSNIK